ncbi:hypothetical protein [uncultured Nonlabens sp.]|uniref:hypothetical protein n=1 Tax=uncultured Nonlabens sp. TaxID=859306 RepID=UPI002608EAA2|nr:hypothetical protein [uncultured Nonlabens sp.]
MKKNKLFLTIALSLMCSICFAQWTRDTTYVDGKMRITMKDKNYKKFDEKIEKEIQKLKKEKKLYESNQRTLLAEEIRKINDRIGKLENYTEEMAKNDKVIIAESYAEKITKHNQLIDSKIEFVKISGVLTDESSPLFIDDDGFVIQIRNKRRDLKKEIKTRSGFTLALGYNYMNGETLGINDFSYPRNSYVSFGYQFQTAISKNQKWRINYGLTLQSHSTELNGNRILAPNTPETQIAAIGFDVTKAQFNQSQIVFPLQFEFGGNSKREFEDGRIRYDQWRKWKIGFGGFVGFNYDTRLKLKYKENGRNIKQITVDAFDTNTIVYGLDAYIGRGDTTLFGRMNLNDVFKSGSVDAQYVSFGIRFQ